MLRTLKSISKLVILIFAGMGMYYAGKNAMGFFDPGQNKKAPRVAKKTAPAKTIRYESPKPRKIEKKTRPSYTFYEVLNDSSMEKFVGLDGNIHRRSAPEKRENKKTAPVQKKAKETLEPSEVLDALESLHSNKAKKKFKAEKNAHQAVLTSVNKKEPLQSLKLLKPISIGSPAKVQLTKLSGAPVIGKNAYALQVSSLRDGHKAQKLVDRLLKKGYDAYFQTKELPSAGSWNRVYIGPFSSIEQAGKARRHYANSEGAAPLLVKLN